MLTAPEEDYSQHLSAKSLPLHHPPPPGESSLMMTKRKEIK